MSRIEYQPITIGAPNFVEVECFEYVYGQIDNETGTSIQSFKSVGTRFVNMAMIASITPETLQAGTVSHQPAKGRQPNDAVRWYGNRESFKVTLTLDVMVFHGVSGSHINGLKCKIITK